MYLFMFPQYFFSMLCGLTWSKEVTFEVGVGEKLGHQDDGNHRLHFCHEGPKYPTLREPTYGTSHAAIVRVLTAICTYEAPGFMDTAYALARMSKHLQAAEAKQSSQQSSQREHAEDLIMACALWGTALDKPLAVADAGQDILQYLREVQIVLRRAYARLVLVGFLQNAVQTKVQIVLLSLGTYVSEGHNEYAYGLLFGVVGNMFGYLLSIFDVFEILELGTRQFYQQQEKVSKILEQRQQNMCRQQETTGRDMIFDEINHRRFYIKVQFCICVIFSLIYLVFFIYLCLAFGMFFKCESHIWNLHWPLADGCWVDDPHIENQGQTMLYAWELASSAK